ncbi:pyridoxamine kinase [Treponema sp.]|uniref:pyridoxamine kinase n=1 Tax=Treponema sp. TaxID=166 RepID=UPI00298E5742|nr:pyridoxamine kinase [Treponema sp.]
MEKRLLTIQDISCVGKCSTTVALPLISACGIECAVLPSSVLSNHTASGYSGWTFRDLTEDMITVMNQWLKEKIDFDAFYTGYVSKEQIPLILEIIEKTSRNGAVTIVDPVMADNGKLYAGFSSDFPQEMKKLVEKADVIMPNLTEASLLLGIEYKETYTKDEIEDIARKLNELGARNVILTGVSFDPKMLGVAVFDGLTFDYYFTEKILVSFHGTGDVFASVVAGALMTGKTLIEASTIAADIVVESIKATLGDDSHWYGVKFEKAIPALVRKINPSN